MIKTVKFTVPFLLFIFLLSFCFLFYKHQDVIKVVYSKPEDKITINIDNNNAIINVYCPSGIGSTSISISKNILKNVFIRLHLKGLEGLSFSYGQVTLEKTYGNNGVLATNLINQNNPKEHTLYSKGSQFYMDVSEREGYIEVKVPEDFMNGGYRDFTVGWIDFYR